MRKGFLFLILFIGFLSISCDDSENNENNFRFSFPTRTPFPERTPISEEDIISTKFEKVFDYDHFAESDNLSKQVLQTLDQGYLILAQRNFQGNYNDHIFLLKLDPYGNEVWNKTIMISNSEFPFNFKETKEGGFIICGQINSDGLILKLDKNGETIWYNQFKEENSQNTLFNDIAELDDGSFIAVGETKNKSRYLLKIDYSGKKLWSKILDESGSNCYLKNILKLDNNNFLVSGNSDNGFYIGKFDENCEIIWERFYQNYYSYNKNFKIIKTNNNNYIFLCQHNNLGTIVIKLDENGNDILQRDLRNVEGYIYCINQLKSGGFIISGCYPNSVDFGYNDCTIYDLGLIKLDNEFNIIWDKSISFYSETYNQFGIDITETLDGGYAILGEGKFVTVCDQYHYGTSNRNIIVVKTDENGNFD